jgi:hypothetical protein
MTRISLNQNKSNWDLGVDSSFHFKIHNDFTLLPLELEFFKLGTKDWFFFFSWFFNDIQVKSGAISYINKIKKYF